VNHLRKAAEAVAKERNAIACAACGRAGKCDRRRLADRAGLHDQSLIQLQNTSPGFDASNADDAVDLPETKYSTPEQASNFFAQLESRISSLPGVDSVGFVSELPLSGQPNDMPFSVEGRPAVTIDQSFDADFRRVNLQYFKTLRIPLLRGRNFTEQEVRQSARVLVISELLARQVFPHEEALGKRLVMMTGNQPWEIIGIAGDIRHRSLDSDPFPAMYMPTYEKPRDECGDSYRERSENPYCRSAEVQGIDRISRWRKSRRWSSGWIRLSPPNVIARLCSPCLRWWPWSWPRPEFTG
jgi:hypothetical protein